MKNFFPFNLTTSCFSMPKQKKILAANEFACKLFGYSKEELPQLPIPELSAEPEQTFDELIKVTKNELKKIPLQYIKPKSGGKIATKITTGVFHIKNKSYVFAIYRNITLQLENQEAITKIYGG